uniref:PD-(D/E)XK nuclease family transposase n=1 Tax=Eubacterium cellulosolvens TaxID=29322 RepID=UPI000487D51D|nr:PD-(D/E)XK nuclease family transposase [[Eubacterium] cellulosolvens]
MAKKVTGKKGCKIELSREISAELEKTLDDLTLFDDDLMGKVFDGNTEATELLLQIILERKDFRIIRVKGQVEFRSPYAKGRTIRLDILATGEDGTEFNVEVQRNTKGSHIRRARYHQSMIDARLLKRNQDFQELKDTYVIFICQHDKFKQNKPVYHVDKTIRETGKNFDDGAHVIYVNGGYRGDDDFGKLAHDFNCKNPELIYYKPLADGVRHIKGTEKGRGNMCEAFERLAEKVADERAEQVTKQVTRQMTNKYLEAIMKSGKISLAEALDMFDITGKDREMYEKQFAEY